MAKQSAGGQEPPTPEQMDELLLVLNKEKMLLQAISKVDKNGKLGGVPPTPDHNNDFLRLNGSEDWLESFCTNFWNQAKDPTKFSLIKIKETDLENDPLVKKAMKDIEEGKITKNVVRFLEKYSVKPDKYLSTNNQKNNDMSKKEEMNNAPATSDELNPPRYRFNENMVDWAQVEEFGYTREMLQQRGLYDQLMGGYKTKNLVPVTAKLGGTDQRFQARLQFVQDDDGRITMKIHPLRQWPDFSRSFLGHNFSEDDKINLLETGNMGRVVPMKTANDGYVDHFVSIDKLTNQITAARVDRARILDEYSGVKLTEEEKNQLKQGGAIEIKGMVAKSGKVFDAFLQYNAEIRRVDYRFPYRSSLNYGQELGTVKLTNKQVDDYNAGKAIYVADMVRKRDKELFDSFVKYDSVSGKMTYSRVNPDNPTEVLVPKEIGGVKITPEERTQLSEGKAIFLNDMYSERNREDFSSWVKLDMSTGYPMYAKTQDGFEEKREFKIPAEAFGVTISAKQRADLQDGKAVLIEGMKGYDGQTFSQWAKVNQDGTKLNYYNENPDIKKDATSRHVTQKPTQKQETSEKKRKGRSQGA